MKSAAYSRSTLTVDHQLWPNRKVVNLNYFSKFWLFEVLLPRLYAIKACFVFYAKRTSKRYFEKKNSSDFNCKIFFTVQLVMKNAIDIYNCTFLSPCQPSMVDAVNVQIPAIFITPSNNVIFFTKLHFIENKKAFRT